MVELARSAGLIPRWLGHGDLHVEIRDDIVYLRADEALRYGKVIEVMDLIKQAGIHRIGFVYQLPEEKTR